MCKQVRFANIILIISLVAFFAPLFTLPFFDHPSADDYIGGYHLEKEGFRHYQSSIYYGWGGRFAATFTGSLFVANHYLYSHYYLPVLILLCLDIISLFFLFFVLNQYILADKWLRKNLIVVCLFFAALQFCSLAEPATYFFWFSSAVTYHLPLILLQLQLALWLVLYHTASPRFVFTASCLIILLIPVINGFNELFVIIQTFLLAILFFQGSYKRFSNLFIATLLIVFIGSAAIVLLSPGSHARMAGIAYKSWYAMVAAIGFQTGEVLWSIFKNPIAWFAGISVYFFANARQEQFIHLSFITLCNRKKWLLPVFVVSFLLLSIGFGIVGLKGSFIPDRYMNVVIIVMILLLLLSVFVTGIFTKPVAVNANFSYLRLLFVIICIVVLSANDFVRDEYKSLVIAPLYDRIMSERENALQTNNNKPEAAIESYETALQRILLKDYLAAPKTISDLLKQKPPFIFFTDDLADKDAKEALCSFYHIRKLHTH